MSTILAQKTTPCSVNRGASPQTPDPVSLIQHPPLGAYLERHELTNALNLLEWRGFCNKSSQLFILSLAGGAR